ncbi:MAG TPA: phytanoyl-CoA dioxygenase family protein [Planctomycetota bacterium]|nr:phytanoyl-CoA dioxygenase family protein [Planctomycetota bacterium]
MPLSDAELKLATQRVRADGYTVFEGLLPRDLIGRLHTEFMPIFEDHVARSPQNRGMRRYQMHLPFRAPFNDARLITNSVALSVIEAILGEDCVCNYFASDTPLPGSDFQAVHSDFAALFPESDIVLPPFALVVNINLVDFREDNGPLEIWPGGTHLLPPSVDMKALAPTMTSRRVLTPAGSLLIRDIRMWHRGTPNKSDAPRPNIAMIFSRSWLKPGYEPIRIARTEFEKLPERAQRLFRTAQVD